MAQVYTANKIDNKTDSPLFLVASKTGQLISVAVFLFVAFWVFLSIHAQKPPAAVAASAPPTEFSSARAMKHVESIARKPHPLGSTEHAEVRNYILKELTAAGLAPEVQTTIGINENLDGPLRAGTVENIVARLKGTDSGKAILIAGHYDSTPTGSGASDDGVAVAAMLEVLRALKASPPLKNDLILLFTDGEEVGMLGADAFVREHPWMKDVGVVLNFEARGSGGPSIMFETSNENGWLVGEFAKAAPSPVANSLSYEIYKLLPNDTDFTVFRKAGLVGLNFAYIEHPADYHTQLDSFASVDERSVQHHGLYALALARGFGNLSLQDRREFNAVYFDLLGSTLIHYSGFWVLPLTIVGVLFFAGTIIVGLRRKRLSFSGVALGFVALLASMITASLVGMLVWYAIQKLGDGPGLKPFGETYQGNLYLLGFVSLALAITSAIYVLFRKKVSVENLTAGGLLWWVLLLVMTSFYLPGASYLFLWPLFFSLIWLAVKLARKDGRPASLMLLALLAVCAIPGIILLAPMIYQMFVGLTLAWVALILVLVVLLLGLLVPHLDLIAAANRWALPGAAVLVGAALLVTGALKSEFDVEHPKLDSVFYALNADSGAATWASLEEKPDEWTAQFFPANAQPGVLPEIFSANSSRQYLKSPALAGALAAPQIEVLDDTTSGVVRSLHLRVSSPRKASVLTFYVDSKAEILSATINGKAVDAGSVPSSVARKKQWSIRYYALPPEGVVLNLDLKSAEPLKLRAVDQSYGLPELQGEPFKSRPADIIPAPVSITDSTFVSKSLTL